jgi:O-antigen/teichoic acid export membrane protein
MNKAKKGYTEIFKATALFGGVQVFQILISLIRTKFVAVLLGVHGVGLLTLLNQTISLLSSGTRLGIDQSTTRQIAIAKKENTLTTHIAVSNRWSWIVGLLGAFITLSFAPQISQFTFGNTKYTVAFYWLACTLFLNSLTETQLAILQGMRQLRKLAKANLWGTTLSLILSLPIYYFYGIEGITPSIIITYSCTFLCTYIYYRKADLPTSKVSTTTTLQEGKPLLQVGIMLMISGFTSTLCSYLINIYLNHQPNGLNDVGLYQSGFTLIERYVGLIFVAMSTDYYPRLSAVYKENKALNEMVNQQSCIGLLIICPIICLFIPTSPVIVRLLFTHEFLPIIPFLSWGILGILFQMLAFSISYVIIAKKEMKLFFLTDTLSYTTIILSAIVGYQLWGIEGLGIAFLFSYCCYFIEMLIVARVRYKIQFDIRVKKIAFITLILSLSSFILFQFLSESFPILSYTLMGIIAFIALIYTWKELNKRIDLVHFLHLKKKS